ncbi:AbrB/MazE/SpoVT family DNA-binding domain-containing protein [Streptomyces sp. NPDC058495]|uniref:AbrB/MazE/SpoVT family DNA-binding domain-containing protein n=1 Tax=unclassified Streptomyces TaxID=2593676 RepID=UPI00365E6F5B
MEHTDPVTVTTTRIGQRGRIILPAQVQAATHIRQGVKVALRTSPDGTITIEPLWTLRTRLRATYGPLLTGHAPAGPIVLHIGGRDLEPEDLPDPAGLPRLTGPGMTTLCPVLGQDAHDPRAFQRLYGEGQPVVLTARAVLSWLTTPDDHRTDSLLACAVLPETAVTDLVTTLAQAGIHDRLDALLADLGALGVRVPGPAKHRATLAHDTAVAVGLTKTAAKDGWTLTLADALCAAAALRLEAWLAAADLLTTHTPAK